MISLQGVSKWYGDFQVLKECSAEVGRGEVVVICGPSGSGKSTLLKTINGLESFQRGTIVIDGQPLRRKAAELSELRTKVGMVFQHFELFPHLSIQDNLTLAQVKVLHRTRGEAIAKGMKLLDRVGLREQADKFPAQLSGGPTTARGHRAGAVDGPYRHAVRRAYIGTRP